MSDETCAFLDCQAEHYLESEAKSIAAKWQQSLEFKTCEERLLFLQRGLSKPLSRIMRNMRAEFAKSQTAHIDCLRIYHELQTNKGESIRLLEYILSDLLLEKAKHDKVTAQDKTCISKDSISVDGCVAYFLYSVPGFGQLNITICSKFLNLFN